MGSVSAEEGGMTGAGRGRRPAPGEDQLPLALKKT